MLLDVLEIERLVRRAAVQIGAPRAQSRPVVVGHCDGTLRREFDPAEALGHIGVQVVDDLEPGLAGGGEERVADRQVDVALTSRRLRR